MVNENINFKVDESKCIKCGLCVKDCTMNVLKMDDFPKMKFDELECIKCEHCFAICPTAAISILGDNPDDTCNVSNSNVNPEEFNKMVKARRSIRQYKNENVDKEVIHSLCESALMAPTARNCLNTLLTVIDDKDKMDEFRNKVYEKFCQINFEGEENAFWARVSKWWKEEKRDKFFAGAPHMIVASAPQDSINIISDPVIILSYFEMLAVSRGLGTLWDGMVTFLLNDILPEFKDYLGIPKEHKVGYVMVFGKPAVKYVRDVKRNVKSNINYIN